MVNYLPIDNLGLAPQVTIQGPAGPDIQEGFLASFQANAIDDVQVEEVELLMDGIVVARDVSASFELGAVTPALATGQTEVSFSFAPGIQAGTSACLMSSFIT